MNTLTKLAQGLIGHLRPAPLQGEAASVRALPPRSPGGGLPLMQVLAQRQSSRVFSVRPLPDAVLSELLWAAAGISRPELGGRTFPSAMNAQEVDVYVALPDGLYLYDPRAHQLRLSMASDVRRVTGYQDFVDHAALDLVFVADHGRMPKVPAAQRSGFAHIAVGAVMQNVYLYCASTGLATVARAWFDRRALAEAMGLGEDHEIVLTQTVGYPPEPN